MALVIAVQGLSGSGKTTLIEAVIPRLRARGLSAGVVKHTHKGFALDRRGKDSQRFWDSGARAVLVAGPDELFVRRRPSCGGLAELMRLLPVDLDCVLIEGFRQQVAALEIPAAVRVQIAPEAVSIDGTAVRRDEAAAALAAAIVQAHEAHCADSQCP